VTTCIYELSRITKSEKEPNIYEVRVKAIERVVVEQVKSIDLDE